MSHNYVWQRSPYSNIGKCTAVIYNKRLLNSSVNVTCFGLTASKAMKYTI